MTKFVSVFITVKDKKEAKTLSRTLIEKRLAACVNIITGIESIYRWHGKIQNNKEVILIAKTKNDPMVMKRLIMTVSENQSYENPAIVIWPIVYGSKDYLKWVDGEVQQ
ncbi:hypothetical protein A3J15_00825 [Candidatus Roizmanbacteria bacterium RIFCSPLOWO2_02_FULL_38_10]|uniref:Cytochrome C biogenesis protein CcdA n=1 Tax=Candidatus Roizmanbacteria bacterium RIFCSPLOWO2_02_FULL_38_10 TaxID=1802074 RepID=A0A1F7JMT3_9BACT|nr:MAG: hypothetical protein A3J15_00825 [Candidatus Roizmanbacteria bacterium RIFCSPLOWO2_02_FULL_38_10]